MSHFCKNDKKVNFSPFWLDFLVIFRPKTQKNHPRTKGFLGNFEDLSKNIIFLITRRVLVDPL